MPEYNYDELNQIVKWKKVRICVVKGEKSEGFSSVGERIHGIMMIPKEALDTQLDRA